MSWRRAKETGDGLLGDNHGAQVAGAGDDGERKAELTDDLLVEHSTSVSVRSIIKGAISSAGKIVDNMKAQAVAEARQEAERIIAEARKEAGKIKEKMPDDAVVKTEKVVAVEEGNPAEAEETVLIQEEVVEPAIETEAMPDAEPADEESVAEKREPIKADKEEQETPRKKPEATATREESQALYVGEVELNIGMPVEPTLVSKLYSYLQTSPEMKFVRTTGSWNRGSTITVMLDKQLPLVSVIAAKFPEANIVPERIGGNIHGHTPKRSGVRQINISLRR